MDSTPAQRGMPNNPRIIATTTGESTANPATNHQVGASMASSGSTGTSGGRRRPSPLMRSPSARAALRHWRTKDMTPEVASIAAPGHKVSSTMLLKSTVAMTPEAKSHGASTP